MTPTLPNVSASTCRNTALMFASPLLAFGFGFGFGFFWLFLVIPELASPIGRHKSAPISSYSSPPAIVPRNNTPVRTHHDRVSPLSGHPPLLAVTTSPSSLKLTLCRKDRDRDSPSPPRNPINSIERVRDLASVSTSQIVPPAAPIIAACLRVGDGTISVDPPKSTTFAFSHVPPPHPDSAGHVVPSRCECVCASAHRKSPSALTASPITLVVIRPLEPIGLGSMNRVALSRTMPMDTNTSDTPLTNPCIIVKHAVSRIAHTRIERNRTHRERLCVCVSKRVVHGYEGEHQAGVIEQHVKGVAE